MNVSDAAVESAACSWVSAGWVCGLPAGHRRKHHAVADWTKDNAESK